MVRSKVEAEDKIELNDVDLAFDYCLTRIAGLFPKRDVFLAISDFSRSLFVLALFGLLPLGRIVLYAYGTSTRYRIGVEGIFLLGLVAWLSWIRMERFRSLSESPVFSTFLATRVTVAPETNAEQNGE